MKKVSNKERSNSFESDNGYTIDWKKEIAKTTPLVPLLWSWIMILGLLAVQTLMIKEYAPSASISTYVISNLLAIGYSWLACTYLFPRFPTIFGIPFFLVGFVPAFGLICYPFFGNVGAEFAHNAPIWVLTAWSAVRLVMESIVQLHVRYGVKGISYWLLWPIQKTPEPYTLTYPIINKTVTRKKGGNLDAFSSLTIGLPVAFLAYLMNDDHNLIVLTAAWIVQIWMFIYLMVLGPLPHFLGSMPGPKNIFDFKGISKSATQMFSIGARELGTAAYFLASYAILHFVLFVIKMI